MVRRNDRHCPSPSQVLSNCAYCHDAGSSCFPEYGGIRHETDRTGRMELWGARHCRIYFDFPHAPRNSDSIGSRPESCSLPDRLTVVMRVVLAGFGGSVIQQ